MIRLAWLVAVKDLRLLLRDRAALAVAFVLPVILATIFAAAIGGLAGSHGVRRVNVLVEDRDRSDLSRRVVEELRRSPVIEVAELDEPGEARARVTDGRAPAALLVPEGWGGDVAAGRATSLVVFRDRAKVVEQQVIGGALVPSLVRAAGPELGKAIARQAGAPALLAELAATDVDLSRAATDALGLAFEDVPDVARTTIAAARSQAIAGIAVMMLLFGLTACGATLLEEEASGTLRRLRLTPGGARPLLLGKAIFTVITGLAQIAVLLAFGALAFGVPVARAPLTLLAVSTATACAAAGLGLLLAVTCRTRKQLEGVSTLLILVMSGLGGSWFPLAIVPDWFRILGHFTLNAWAMDGYQAALWYGKGVGAVWRELAVLLGLAALFFALSARAWRRRVAAA